MLISIDDIIRVALAIFIGGLIGAEREYRDKAAGFRTLIFITLGSTLFTMFSMRMGGPNDPVRIAANIVTGIGFLGAGTILRGEHGVTGLTTAAAIWLSAALGVGIGGGELGLVGMATVAVLIVLWIFPFFERWIDRAQQTRMYEVVVKLDDEKLKQIEQLFKENGLRTHHHRRCKRGDMLTLNWLATAKPGRHEAVADRLLHDPEVLEVRY